MAETKIITIDVNEYGVTIHEPMVCSGIITISGTDPYKYQVCENGHVGY